MSLAWLVAWLLGFITLANFGDFILGEDGKKRVKDRLADWYVAVAGTPWALIQSSSRALARYIDMTFGKSIFPVKYFAFAVAFGAAYIVIEGALLLKQPGFHLDGLRTGEQLLNNPSFSQNARTMLPRLFSSMGLFLVISNATIDTVALSLLRSLLRALATAKGGFHRAFILIGMLLVALMITVIAFIVVGIVGLSGGDVMPTTYRWEIGKFAYQTDFRALNLFLIPSLVSAVVIVTVILSSTFLALTRPITQRPLSVVLERLAETPQNVGVLTIVATGMSAVVGLMKAVQEALK